MRAVREGTITNKINPVFVGSALKYIGVQRLLDGVVAYLPSPLEKPVLEGHKPGDEDKKIKIKCDPDESLVALAFKITSDSHGDLSFLRLYQDAQLIHLSGSIRTVSVCVWRKIAPDRQARMQGAGSQCLQRFGNPSSYNPTPT